MMHDQTIVCTQLLAGHMVGTWPMRVHRMIIAFLYAIFIYLVFVSCLIFITLQGYQMFLEANSTLLLENCDLMTIN